MSHIVTKEHMSSYPDPLILYKGQHVLLGKRDDGPEGWRNWIFCYNLDQTKGGWVPENIIEVIDEKNAAVTENYYAKELDITVGEAVIPLKEWDGWAWCERISNGEKGWIPLTHIEKQKNN